MIPPAAPTLDNPRHPARLGLPVVMEQERTLSRLAELSAVPVATGVGSLRDGSPACGEEQGHSHRRRESWFRPCAELSADSSTLIVRSGAGVVVPKRPLLLGEKRPGPGGLSACRRGAVSEHGGFFCGSVVDRR